MENSRSEKSTVTRVGFNQYDIAATESWLTDMARQGMILEKAGAFFTVFTRKDPKPNRRYRIAPVGTRFWSGRTIRFEDEQNELFRSSGWEPVCYRSGLAVLFTDDTDAPELFDDMKSYRLFAKRYLRDLVVYLAVMVFVFWNMVGSTATISSLFSAGLTAGDEAFASILTMVVTLALTTLLILLLVVQVAMAVYRIYTGGSQIDHEKPYARSVMLRKLLLASFVLLFVLLIAMWAVMMIDLGIG